MSGWKSKLGGLAAPLKEYAEKACAERMSAVSTPAPTHANVTEI